jgi:hypothetical protein
MMAQVLERLFVIALFGGLALWDGNSVRRNIKTGVIWAWRGTRFRDQSPFDFWGYVVLKITGVTAAAIFALAYLYMAATT